MPGPSPILSLLSGSLLAAASGLNPYLPLLIASVMARYAGRFHPRFGYAFLGETWFVALAAGLFLADIFLDKIFLPGDSLAVPPRQRSRRLWIGAIHDLGQMVLGPVGGALLLGAAERVFPPAWPLVAPMLGVLLAALVYVGKRSLRHRLSRRPAKTLGPLANMLLSTIGDLVVVLLCTVGLLLGPR